MTHFGKWFSTLLSVLLLASLFVTPAWAKTPQAKPPSAAGREGMSLSGTGPTTRLLSDTSAGLTFEVSVPWEQLNLQPVMSGGKEYVRVSLPGWSQTTEVGAPALPLLTEQIGAPFGDNLSLRVVPGKAHTQKLPSPVIPVATQKVKMGLPPAVGKALPLPVPVTATEEDASVYAGNTPYPGSLGRLASDGVLRQQRVEGIAIYPVQYSPGTMELTIYESLRVEITFEGTPATASKPPSLESAAYESVLEQDLLNYTTARQWRQPVELPSSMLDTGNARSSIPWAPPAPGWRVKVRQDGFYKLSYTDLNLAGLPVTSLDPRTFRLYNLGSEVAIYVEGQVDGIFDPADYILFYGQAIASKYTADNVYWLTYGNGLGLRMNSRNDTPNTATTPVFYPAMLHVEANTNYITLAAGDENLERWVWDYVYASSGPASWTHTIPLAAPYAAQAATLKINLLGYVEDPINPDHHAAIYLNNTLLGDVWWDGLAWQTSELAVPAGLLLAGDNTLKVTAVNDTGVGYDVFFIDWAELNFSNTFLAENDKLAFTYKTAGTWKYQVGGFTSNQVDVYDVTTPAAPVRITGTGFTGSGPYTAAFQETVTGTTNYWAGTSTAYYTVQKNEIKIEKDTASNLQATTNGADHLVITHSDFLAAATSLSTYRASQGLRARTVDVQDIYDEFNYGIVGVAPIHDFLAYAYANWQKPAPSYVVLVGDGNYDPKNYMGFGRTSYMPPYLAPVDPWITETAADNRYVTLAGSDTLPDMMLGRLSVNSPAEASTFINKIINYEQNPAAGWQEQVLMVTDNADSAGNFAQFSDDLLSCCLPPAYAAQKVYYGVTHTSVDTARAAIQSGINAGKLIVNYVGHAYYTGWASENLFKTADVPLLTNGALLPIILSMSCRDGYFIAPDLYTADKEALAEVETRANGRGSVASWSPTGLGVSSGHDYLDRGFFNAVFRDGKATVGEATAAGKLNLFSTGSNLDLLDTFSLFGDPALRIPHIPTEVTFSLTINKVGNGTVTPDLPAPYHYGDVVHLIASADPGWTFTGWSGACTGIGTCTVTMNANRTVTATFTQNVYTLTINKVGNGTVTPDLAAPYHYGDVVHLTASADPGWTFTGWSGACTGTGTCTVTMNANKTVTATFTQNVYTLTINKVGSGTAKPDLAAPYHYGDIVHLTASADPGWTFIGWSGACTGTGICTLTMNANKVVTATFSLTTYYIRLPLIMR